MFQRLLFFMPCLLVLMGSVASAQDSADLRDPGQWELEHVELRDGTRLSGLVSSRDERTLELIEVRRPQGRPMSILVRSIPQRSIGNIERLPPRQRALLADRIDLFRNRTGFQRGQMDAIELRAVERDGIQYQLYDEGEWFTLQTTIDEEMARRSIVRIEQIFAAYRRILPPTVDQQQQKERRPAFLLFGSVEEYRGYLAMRGWNIGNPAVYSVDENLVAAGSQISRYAEQLQKVRARHEALLAQKAELNARMPQKLAQLAEQLDGQGTPQDERRRIVVAYQKSWDDQASQLEQEIKQAERRNVAQFDDVTAKMFARLSHEAFHAYLESYVFPGRSYHIPRWLNEGLAQVFEDGVLDGDVLRIDSPNPKKLSALVSDLGGADPLRLATLLAADEAAFLIAHSSSSEGSARHYLHCWGLAYFLMFRHPVLSTEDLKRYTSAEFVGLDEIERFEKLVEMPLEEFEVLFRKEMMN